MVEVADTVLAQVRLTYQGLNSYTDRGFMESRHDPNSAVAYIRKLNFSTQFRRPNLFRFAWHSPDNDGVNVVWCDGKSVFAKHSYDIEVRHIENLSRAIAGATGISGGTAHTVSSLLMNEVRGSKLTDRKYSVYRGTEIINGEDCYHLQQASQHVFISKSNSTIVRIDDDHIIAAGSIEKALRSTRFQSFGLFKHWLWYVLEFRNEKDEDLRVITSTVYDEILLNPDIPDECFTEEGAI